jgi:hypothetical protein
MNDFLLLFFYNSKHLEYKFNAAQEQKMTSTLFFKYFKGVTIQRVSSRTTKLLCTTIFSKYYFQFVFYPPINELSITRIF